MTPTKCGSFWDENVEEGKMNSHLKTTSFLLFSCLAVLSLACKETVVVYVPVVEKPSIIGTWDWVESGPWPTYTPASTGDTVVAIFTADSVFSLYIDGLLDLFGPFKVYRGIYPPYTTDTTDILVINWSPSRGGRYYGVTLVCNDTLKLKPYVTDAAEYLKYVRRR